MVGKHSVGIKFKINISQISFRSLNWPELFKTLKQAMYQTKPVEINLYLQLANQCWWTFLIILTARFYFNKSFLANSLFKLLFRFIFVWPKSRKTVTRFSSFLTVRGLAQHAFFFKFKTEKNDAFMPKQNSEKSFTLEEKKTKDKKLDYMTTYAWMWLT
jgi:hypothetical protein